MPNKIVTETQICRLLGATSIPVALTLCLPDSYRSKTTPASHIASFYRPWSQLRDERFDGLVVTGAPIETLPFEEVTYWPDLVAILDWAKRASRAACTSAGPPRPRSIISTRVPKHPLPAKMSGVFRQRVRKRGLAPAQGLRRGVPGAGVALHGGSRRRSAGAGGTDRARGLARRRGFASSRIATIARSTCSITWNTTPRPCGDEFLRDRLAGKPVGVPANYFPDDDPARAPVNVWRPSAISCSATGSARFSRRPGRARSLNR